MPAEAASASRHEPGGDWMDLLVGFTRADPQDAPGSLKTAFLLWRITVFLVPLTCLVVGLLISDAGAQLRADAEAMREDWMLILLSFGLYLIIAMILWLIGAVLTVVATLMLVVAIPVGLLFNLALGRTLRGANRSAAPGLWAMFSAAVVALFTIAPFSSLVVSWTGAEPLGAIITVFVLGVPLVAFILLAKRGNRTYLRDRHAQTRPSSWIRVPESEPPSPRQYP